MLRVKEIMQGEVKTATPETTVQDLVRLLSEQGISGVPVVASTGRLLGVVSAADVVRLAAEDAEPLLPGLFRRLPLAAAALADEEASQEDDEMEPFATYFLPEQAPVLESEWEAPWAGGAFDGITVEDIMTPVSFTIDPEATLEELANFLVRGRIHRAVVTQDERLVGIVTTMDVLRAVAAG